jgi:uncharacterized protein
MDLDAVNPVAHAAALWTGLNILTLLVLSLLVVRQRGKHKVLTGDGGVPELLQAMRAFGNASEYVPAALAGLVALAVVQASPLAVHIPGALLFMGRVTHAIGLSATAGTSLARGIGMIATWLAYVFLAFALFFYGIG